MQLRSLSSRLLLTSLGWSAFAVIATGLVLASAFREIVEERFDQTLDVYLSILIGELAQIGDQRFSEIMPDLQEPRFELPLSGWYWMVFEAGSGEVLQTSESLAGDLIETPTDELASLEPWALYRTYVEGPAGEPLRLVVRRIAFEDGRWFLVAVSGAADTIEADTTRFARQLALFLGIFSASLIAATYVQWRISLRPLTQLGTELEAIREGKARHVSERYPSEIAPVADALNTLIDSNDATLERARRHVGNLAHALKTPLSVLVNDAAGEENALARSVREQTLTMQRQVRYYLERAQMAARERMIGTMTDVRPVLERLVRALGRLGERRGIDVDLVMEGEARFAGERQDFEEIVGNLVDNALKWAKSEVRVALVPGPSAERGRAEVLTLTIDDDGPGLSRDARQSVLSRGKRLDQSKPGSGLGLSIVTELVELYGGSLTLDVSPLGGLRATVRLPQG